MKCELCHEVNDDGRSKELFYECMDCKRKRVWNNLSPDIKHKIKIFHTATEQTYLNRKEFENERHKITMELHELNINPYDIPQEILDEYNY